VGGPLSPLVGRSSLLLPPPPPIPKIPGSDARPSQQHNNIPSKTSSKLTKCIQPARRWDASFICVRMSNMLFLRRGVCCNLDLGRLDLISIASYSSSWRCLRLQIFYPGEIFWAMTQLWLKIKNEWFQMLKNGGDATKRVET
jgi:hypothetical protein